MQLTADLDARDEQLQQCTTRNHEMYQVAREVLDAYERIDVADVVKLRQPFASRARVKFEELAQSYGDRLYDTQFDAALAPKP